MKCHWWNRWYHRKLREIDLLQLLPVFQLKAETRVNEKYLNGTFEWYLERDALVDKLFELHKNMPGQEYWHCECSRSYNVLSNPTY